MEATGIILAGGKSGRMGTNKALLKIEGKTVIELIVQELKKVVNNIMIVTNSLDEYRFLNLPMVEDKWKGMGPLAGIQAGLTASPTKKNIIVACDMPFISHELALIMLEQLSDYQAVVPEISGRLHPLFAAYRKDVKEEAEKSLKANNLRIMNILRNLNVKIVTKTDFEKVGCQWGESNFFNMNNPQEFKEALIMGKNSKGQERDT